MRELTIRLSDEEYETLKNAAARDDMSPEQKVLYAVHTVLVPAHTMNEESLKKGYEETGAINLEWADLK